MRETEIEKYLKRGVEKRGGLCIKFVPICYAGFPDRLVFLPGGFFRMFELKSREGRLSYIQKVVHLNLASRGFKVHLIFCTIDADNFFKEYDEWLGN